MPNVDNTKHKKILSVCSGSLGLERGMELAGFRGRAVAYVEREAFAAWNLVGQMEKGVVDQAPIWADVKTFDPQPFRDRIHGIVGGYPCQGESIAGERKLQHDERYVWTHLFQIVSTIRPIFCFFENVHGHLRGTFPKVLADLRSIGYSVEPGIYSAREVGAPHTRKRLFILAYTDRDALRRCVANPNSQQRHLPSQQERNEKIAARESSKNLSDTNGSGSRKDSAIYQTEQPYEDGTHWPAPPGRKQHEWEHKRLIESRLGSTVDGYDFRRDLLRLYGNAVVPATAGKAWYELTNQVMSSFPPPYFPQIRHPTQKRNKYARTYTTRIRSSRR